MTSSAEAVETPQGLLRLDKIDKYYTSKAGVVHAISGASMIVRQGEYVAITGPSGSGKSTLLGVLGLLEPFQNGSYHIADRDVSELTFNQRSVVRNQYIGLIFQAFNLISAMTVLENVLLPLRYSEAGVTKEAMDRAHELLDRVGLDVKLNSYPNELSGGQQQRVAIARSMVTQPAILLADEPTGNLDSRTSAEILRLFSALHAEGVTLLMVTHDAGFAAQAERIIEISDGVISRG